jgi:diadenylate cyclase
MYELLEYLLGPDPGWRDLLLALVDIGIIAFLCYRILLLIRGTRAVQVLIGLFVIGLAHLVSQWAGLVTLNWLFGHFITYTFIFGVIVLFQSDIRRGLAHLGRGSFLDQIGRHDRVAQVKAVEAVVEAAVELSRRKTGALIVLERIADLSEVVETGVKVDAALSPELLLSLFQPSAPMHDGAAVIQGGRLSAAHCVLPLTSDPSTNNLGTRHRAALGLAEEVDAAVVVVSEERSEISLAVRGTLERGLDEERLRRALRALYAQPVGGNPARRVFGFLNALLSGRRRAPQPAETPAPGKETGAAL